MVRGCPLLLARRGVQHGSVPTKVVIPPHNVEAAPTPPTWLAEEAHGAWDELWCSGIASTWTVGEHDLVGRLALLRTQFRENGGINIDTLSRLHVQIHKLEQALLLTPESQRRANVVTEETKVVSIDRRASIEAVRARVGNAD